MKVLIVIATVIMLTMVWLVTSSASLLELLPEHRKEAQEFVDWIKTTYPDHKLVVAEVYRTQARQDRLHAKGRHITQIKVSKHTKRKAMDLYFVKHWRILQYDEAPYQEIGEEWMKRGHIWGGSWTTLKDYGHFEWR